MLTALSVFVLRFFCRSKTENVSPFPALFLVHVSPIRSCWLSKNVLPSFDLIHRYINAKMHAYKIHICIQQNCSLK